MRTPNPASVNAAGQCRAGKVSESRLSPSAPTHRGLPILTTYLHSSPMYHVSMTNVPTWLIYATPAIASSALLVALGSMLIARAAYRRSGPSVRVHCWIATTADEVLVYEPPISMIISAANRGLAPVDVERILVQNADFTGKHFRWRFDVSEVGVREDGPGLPVQLKPGTTVRWAYGLREVVLYNKVVAEEAAMYSALLLAQVVLQLGNGAEVRFRPDIQSYGLYVYFAISQRLKRQRES